MRTESAAPGGSLSGVESARVSAVDLERNGCDEAMAVLHVYVDLTAAGVDAAGRYPGVAAHLAACGPCSEDFAGLLLAVTNGGG